MGVRNNIVIEKMYENITVERNGIHEERRRERFNNINKIYIY